MLGVMSWADPYFSPDGHEVHKPGFYDVIPAQRWKIVKDGEFGTTKLQSLEVTMGPPGLLPWESPHGYKVTENWWILGPTQKRLLWLPPRWRSREKYRTWCEQFLGLLHYGLPEVVILELPK